MPQIMTLDLNTVALQPVSGQSGPLPAVLREQGTGSYDSNDSLTILLKDSSAKNMRNTIRSRHPLVRVVDGVDTVQATATASLDLTLPKISTGAERLALLDTIKELCANSAFRSSVENLSTFY